MAKDTRRIGASGQVAECDNLERARLRLVADRHRRSNERDHVLTEVIVRFQE